MASLLLTKLAQAQAQVNQLVKNQTILGRFTDWEDWYQIFIPAYESYVIQYNSVRQLSSLTKPAFIDYQKIASDMMFDDCNMTILD